MHFSEVPPDRAPARLRATATSDSADSVRVLPPRCFVFFGSRVGPFSETG